VTQDAAANGQTPVVSASEAVAAVRDRGAGSMLDVRTPAEVAAEHVEGTVCIPLDELDRRIDEVRSMPGAPLVLCRSGQRARKAMEVLRRHDIQGATVVEGGILAWTEAGGATRKGKGAMSLERQVRIAAGSIVALGSLLGFVVHPAFHGLSAFVGCGLVFAGVTDTCGMGMLIARMPWNRRG